MSDCHHKSPRLPSKDWRDCGHCAHYSSAGNSRGTPPWSVCQFWPRRSPESCGSYSYTQRPYLNEDGVHYATARITAP